jgi:tetratricopeptide (TPR) repeat protein
MMRVATFLILALLPVGARADATNAPAATEPALAAVAATNDAAADAELKKLMEADDAAQAEVDEWIRENQEFAKQNAGVPNTELNQRILKRFEPIRQGYKDFIDQHPSNAAARLAYASFLHDLGEEGDEALQLEKARELDPGSPAVWNQLANFYGHVGELKKAFQYYEKAIALDPSEPIYYWNFGTTVYLFRTDVKEYYGINEQQVFDKALNLYSNATRLDPTNFILASDVAQTYYAIKPFRPEAALRSWTNALKLARDEIEREGVEIHLARVKWLDDRLDEARAHLAMVTNAMYNDLKTRIARNIEVKEHPPEQTNSPAKEGE